MASFTIAIVFLLLLTQYGLIIADLSRGGRIQTLLEYFYFIPFVGLMLILLRFVT